MENLVTIILSLAGIAAFWVIGVGTYLLIQDSQRRYEIRRRLARKYPGLTKHQLNNIAREEYADELGLYDEETK